VEERLKKQIAQLEQAVENYQESLNIDLDTYPEIVKDSIKNGQIQKFEFCIELYWKTLKRYLQDIHGIDSNSPKQVIKKGCEAELYEYAQYETLIRMIEWRNELSHIYNEKKFYEIYRRLLGYKDVWPDLISAFQKRV